MFAFAILIGLYSYSIFLLGITHLLYPFYIFLVTLVFAFFVFWASKKIKKGKTNIDFKNKFNLFIFILLMVQLLINLIGVLGPEISFDSLWYHLTLPKIYIMNHAIFHISGNLLYYSDMPKSIEMIYVAMLTFGTEILAKFVHFLFGVLIIFVIYKFSKRLMDTRFSLLACLIFASNLVFGWESITAYVDLGRTFFEILALYYILIWSKNQEIKNIYKSSMMLGFAVTTKLIALVSIPIFWGIILYSSFIDKIQIRKTLVNLVVFSFISILVPLPWFIFSFLNTGDPFYPFLSILKLGSGNIFSIGYFINSFKELFIYSQDPINPIYIILLPLVIISFKKFENSIKIITLYAFLALIGWYFTPKLGGGRFILPYLPAFSILSVYTISKIKSIRMKNYLIGLIILFSIISIFYRGLANYKFLPVVLGKETKAQFLTTKLNFKFGDFYDTDNYFKNNIKTSDKILLFGFHNLYYVDFPFIDSSFVKKGDKFDYIATQFSNLPAEFSNWKIIYYNRATGVKLYSNGGMMWVY